MALTEEQKKKTDQAALGYLAGHGRNFLRSMNPRNTEPMEQVQPWGEARAVALGQGQAVDGLGIGGLKPSHARGAAILAATPQQPPADPSKVAARENLARTAATPSTPANPVATPPVAGPTNMITAGAQGQDGYGMAKRGLSDGTGAIGTNRMGAGQVGGYSFRGTGADFASFARQPTMPALQDGNTVASQPAAYLGVRDRHEANNAARDNLAGLDPRSGWGWKGRRELYLAQQGLGQRASEEQTRAVMDAARLLSGQQQNQAQIAEQQRQFNEGAPLRQAETEAKQLEAGYTRMKNELAQRWQQATDPKEKEALYRQMLGMEGKEPRNNIETVDVPNPADPMGGTMKVPARINPDGTYTRLQEQGGQQDDPWARIQGNPARLNAFNALPPEKKAEFIQKLYQ